MKRVRYTIDHVEAMSGSMEESPNCGVGFASSLSNEHTPADLMGLRRVAGGTESHWHPKYGQILAVSTDRERLLAKNLKRAGFKKVSTFKNPNTRRTLTLWSAKPLTNGGRAVEDQISAVLC